MSDLINRQAAIAKLFNELVVLDELPSIRPKTGQWLINSDGYYPYFQYAKTNHREE